MIAPNTEMVRQQMVDLVTKANGKNSINPVRLPFDLYTPSHGDVLNNRGGFSPSNVYNRLDLVQDGGYDFVAMQNGVTTRPLNASTGAPDPEWSQPWYSVYNRIRAETHFALGATFADLVSGPWPLTDPTSTQFTGTARNIEFYFPDTGGTVTVSISVNANTNAVDPDAVDRFPAAPKQPPYTSLTIQFVVGGDKPVSFTGRFRIPMTGAVTGTGTTNFPGAVFTAAGGQLATPIFTTTVNPGIYTFNLTATGTSAFNVPFLTCDNASITYSNSAAAVVPGIHDTKAVKKIVAPVSDPASGFPMGFFGNAFKRRSTYLSAVLPLNVIPMIIAVYQSSDNPSVRDDDQVYYWVSQNPTLSATTAGIWFGISRPITTVGIRPYDLMPWNTFPVTGGGEANTNGYLGYILPYTAGTFMTGSPTQRAYNSVDSPSWISPSNNAEMLPWPKRWKAGTVYPLGFVILDTHGNLQQVIVSGRSGTVQPTWPIALNDVTAEPLYHGILGRTQPGVQWKLVTIASSKLAAAVARISPPVYPCYWDGHDTPPVLTNTPASFNFAPQGWWLYRIALNRIPQTKSTDKPSGTVAVTLGCIRNGAFVAFGTYNTGQIIDAMWPIFTNTALCYQSAERVDVQAEIITCGSAFGTWGNVDYPMAAAYMNDLNTILDQVP